MTFNCIDTEGNAVFGDRQVDDGMKAMCDAINGTIVDDQTGKVVYPVPGQEGDITYPIPEEEKEYIVDGDEIVAVEDGEVAVQLDMPS